MVRARIAQIILGANQACARLGGITLKPHQQSAVARVEAALEEFGGALLCDDVGMGKTFVATAVARRFSRTLIVAPAALASMWRDALATTGTSADFLTLERLSRTRATDVSRNGYDLVVVDEAHHARNPATRRYRNLARLTRDARIVLLSATPIHNRATEMSSLLALFLGSRARALTADELARCVVRRERGELLADAAIPIITPTLHRQLPDNPRIVEELMALPPPLPVRDGGVGGALIGRGLVHQWASSEAALHEAVRRRIARAAALIASLEAGNYPTASELETWIYCEGALQLGFPELLSSPTDGASALLDAVRSHSDALAEFHARHRCETSIDAQRADQLVEIRKAHPSARIVAFAQYAETVSMLFSRLSATRGVATLSARGGLVAGGRLTRDETLARFAPRASHVESPPRAEQIDLLLTTDLLSEGVNLQDAEVVIHLDVPWTAARLEQRVGRLARMGSLIDRVHVYLLRPPASAAALLRSEVIVQAKWDEARRAIGSSTDAPFAAQLDRKTQSSTLESIPAKTERLRGILESWRRAYPASESTDVFVAAVRAQRPGFVAAVSIRDEPLLLSSASGCVSADLDSQIAACLLCEGEELEADLEDCKAEVTQINRWFEHDLASRSAGVSGSHSLARKRLFNRIDSAIQGAPPHVRARRSLAAARAKDIVTSQRGAAFEAELEALARSPLADEEWLEAIASLETPRTSTQRAAPPATCLKIRALLLLRPTTRRSRSPRGQGSP
jgi:superfamily II DNA or RNA helicase